MKVVSCFGAVILATTAFPSVSPVSFAVGRKTPVVDGTVSSGEYAMCIPYAYQIKGRDAQQQTFSERAPESYFAWDDACLYVAMASDGRCLKANATEHDGNLWDDDSIDLLIVRNSAKAKVCHFIFNSIGTVFDERGGDRGWTADGLRVKNAVAGGRWQFEAAIPWSTLGLQVRDMRNLRVNLARTYLSGSSAALNGIDAVIREVAAVGSAPFANRELMPILHLRETCGFCRFPPPPKAPHPGEPSRPFLVSIRDDDGRNLFRAEYMLRSRVPVTYRGMTVNPERQELVLLTENWLETTGDATIELDFRDFETDSRSVLRTVLPAGEGHGLVEQRADISALEPGRWNVHYAFRQKDGTVLAQDYAYLHKPGTTEPWTGFAGGTEDTVFAPWTEPVADDGRFSCWGRTYAFGGAGLVTSVLSAGDELLAAPVTLLADGSPVRFDCALVRRGRSFADYRFVAKDAPFPLSVALHAEFDGYLWFDVTYGGGPVGSLELAVPVRRDRVAAFDDSSSAVEKLMLRPGVSGEWKRNPSMSPFWWIGDLSAGLMGGVDNCRGWHFADKPSGMALQVDERSATCRLRFVDTPFEPGEPRTVGFYLQATPTRPRNDRLAAESRRKTYAWAAGISRFFEAKVPGLLDGKNCAVHSKHQREGGRVFWYNGTLGFSPVSPWWTWYGGAWNLMGDALARCLEIPRKDRKAFDRCVWTWACLNERGFYDFKNASIAWFLKESGEDVRNLYFDLAFPRRCGNARHGCVWKDEFGFTHRDWNMRTLRETHKRLKRQLLSVSPDGAFLGHLQFQRTPSDVFFDAAVMGEVYEEQMKKGPFNYYGILQPEAMQVNYVMRANELLIWMIPQITRCMEVFAPDRLRTYDPSAPESVRAIRHAVAYFRIHGLQVEMRPDRIESMRTSWYACDLFLESLGRGVVHKAYYDADAPFAVDRPEPGFLYSRDVSPRGSLTVFLNDTDATVVKHITSPDFSGELTLGPREARFVEARKENDK